MTPNPLVRRLAALTAGSALVLGVIGPRLDRETHAQEHAATTPISAISATWITAPPTTAPPPTLLGGEMFLAPTRTTEDSADTADALHRCWARETLRCDVVATGPPHILAVIGYAFPLTASR